MSREDVEAWIAAEPAAVPAPGAVGQEQKEALRQLIAPGYFDYFNVPEVQIEIQATTDYQPH